MVQPVKIGLVGCGDISGAYLGHASVYPILDVVACADLDMDRARARAEEFGVPRALSVADLLADPEIEIVLNLTVPRAHVPVSRQAIAHGKHAYSEKPLGLNREDARSLLGEAAAKGLRVGCAPDTFLGAGLQTARKVIDDGLIGTPVAAAAFMMGLGPESYHPSPEFFYQPGGGPMFDMGPYYVTTLLNLLGPIKRLMGMGAVTVPERTITSQPLHGIKIMVNTPDHVAGLLEFAGDAVATLVTSFATHEAQYDRKHPITIYGTEGTLKVPDPNNFDGQVSVFRKGEWQDVPHAFPTGYERMVGVADMAHAIRSSRPHRASGEQAYAVLDVMQGFLDSSQTGRAYLPTAGYERPAPMSVGLPYGVLE